MQRNDPSLYAVVFLLLLLDVFKRGTGKLELSDAQLQML